MTEAEKKEIVALVMAEISGQSVDFDLQTVTPQRTDILPAVRPDGEGGYTGVTLDWGGITDELTTQAKRFRDDALQAKSDTEKLKGETNDIKSDVEDIYRQFNEAVDKTIESVRNVYQSDLSAEATAREEADQTLKKEINGLVDSVGELNEKKITKFYASSLGNTNLPDSDNGKLTDMKIYGKSVQNGTPTPETPIEIQSVVNPKTTVYGKNLFDINILNTSGITVSGNEAIGTLFTFHRNFVNGIKGLKIPKGVITFSASVYTNVVKENSISLSVYFQYTDGSNKRIEYLYSEANTKTRKSFTSDKNKTVSGISLSYGTDGGTKITISDIQLEVGSTATDYEPYKEQTASLPYTLNAIPVSEGGNVTIDGQQYIADYVDVERKKLVRNIVIEEYSSSDGFSKDGGSENIEDRFAKSKQDVKAKIIMCNYTNVIDNWGTLPNAIGNGTLGSEPFFFYIRISGVTTLDELNTKLSTNPLIILFALSTPIETDLTDAELEAFKALETYYPVTNVSVTSDQVNGATVFNYPLNMANGWNYVMEQIGETRPIIYDTEVKVLENSIDTAILTAMMEA